VVDDQALCLTVVQEAILSQLLRIDCVGCFFHERRKERLRPWVSKSLYTCESLSGRRERNTGQYQKLTPSSKSNLSQYQGLKFLKGISGILTAENHMVSYLHHVVRSGCTTRLL